MLLPNYAVTATLLIFATLKLCSGANILMVTLGGTKSHKIPYWELARGLIPRGHNITFISPFPPDFYQEGLEEVTPADLVFFVKNFTNWDLIGPKMRGEDPVTMYESINYAYRTCDSLLGDPETQNFLHSGRTFDLIIMDGAYPECSVGFAHHFNVPFMYINTVGFYMGSISVSGSPAPYSVTPFFGRAFTDEMSLFERTLNTGYYLVVSMAHSLMVHLLLEQVLTKHLGSGRPQIYETMTNVSFILQNGHHSVSYPRPYLPNVAEIACIHCKPAKPLPKDLEDFINDGGDQGFIFVSMGSSVKEGNMPDLLKFMLLRVFGQLPYKVLWKWDTTMANVPKNVRISRWLPQQDILGHPKIRAFVTHGGLLSMFETVYHGVPVVTIPVFCDHDANAAKAEVDGYALKLNLQHITAEKLHRAIKLVVNDSKYKHEVKKRQLLLRDQKESPLERAIFWTEYVLRHRGAPHLRSPARKLGVIQYYLIDVFVVYSLIIILLFVLSKYLGKYLLNHLSSSYSVKIFQGKKLKTT